MSDRREAAPRVVRAACPHDCPDTCAMEVTVRTDPEAVIDAKLILGWGGNPVVSNLHGWRYLQEAKRRWARLRIVNDRDAFHARAAVTETVRRGVVAAPSIWWRKFSGDGQNANAVTSGALTDMGGGAEFYDCLVEVERA